MHFFLKTFLVYGTHIKLKCLNLRHFMERNLMDKYDRRLTSQVVTQPESNRISAKPYFGERNYTGERQHMSSGENKETDKVRIIKTLGRGMMEIRRGETVNVPNSLTQKEVMCHKMTCVSKQYVTT